MRGKCAEIGRVYKRLGIAHTWVGVMPAGHTKALIAAVGRGRKVKNRIHLAETVIRTEKEELVLDDRRSHASAELVLLMYRLRKDHRCVSRVDLDAFSDG